MKYLYAIGVCLVLALSACIPSIGGNTSSGDTVGTALAQTQAVLDSASTMAAQTLAAAGQTGGNVVAPPAGNEQPVVQAITATTNINLNCRYGPGASYDIVEVVNLGTSAPIIAKNTTTSPAWYKLQLADGQECWAGSDNLTITGNVAGLTEITTGFPTPRPPNYLWVGTWTIWQNECFSNDISCEQIVQATFAATGPNTVVATYNAIGCTWHDYFTITSDGMYANGTNTCGSTVWEAHLRMDPNHNQFRGRWNLQGNTAWDGYYAGARNGYGKPSPTR
jgi:hypothetical protein